MHFLHNIHYFSCSEKEIEFCID